MTLFSPAGPQFNEQYDNRFTFNTRSSMETIHLPPSHETGETKYMRNTEGKVVKIKILSIPVDEENDRCVVQESDNGNISEILAEDILAGDPDADPSQAPSDNPFHHIPWLKHNNKVTIILAAYNNVPKQGIVIHDEPNKSWHFRPGRKDTNDAIPLKDFERLAESMIENKRLFEGWKPSRMVLSARNVRVTSNLIAHMIVNRKVSAKNLQIMEAPTLLKHSKLHPDDKKIWDDSYREEYQGLVDIDTWETITEDEYEAMKHLYSGIMPTMAISTIKYNGNGEPERAKYRIVALGNLDTNTWSKQDCFAPVMSQFELRFLTAIAARKKCIPKTGDVKQAFCQSYLPEGENYICRPPPGCPLTPSKTYWKLKKTLYGLKRSPRHFYELAKKILIEVGMKPHPTSPCLFTGVLIKGRPPLYLGLYVDDFVYFSEDSEVEEKFKTDFGAKIDTDFNGKIGYFLGINFQTTKHDDGNVSILMTQEAFIDNLAAIAGLNGPTSNPDTPYRSGYPVDKIPKSCLDPQDQMPLTKKMRILVGCLNWLSISTRPDISTITNMLAKYSSRPSQAHLTSVKRVIKYLKGTKQKGILFTSKPSAKLSAYVKFPVESELMGLTDANWGPQDQQKPKPTDKPKEVDIFKSRSLSGFLLWLSGPIHWVSKRQTITARSSAEAEIYAVDECTKYLLYLKQIIEGLDLQEELMPSFTKIYNDNNAAVCWSKNSTTKGLRHVQIRENAVRESVLSQFIKVLHIAGKINLADMFTKEDKDAKHFIRPCLKAKKKNIKP